MADLQRTVEIIFGAVDNTSNTIQAISSGLDKLSEVSGKVETATAPIAELVANLFKIESAAAAAATAIGVYAFNTSVQFESANTGLKKVLADSETDLVGYGETIKGMALKFGESGISVTQLATDFKQASFTIGESMTLTENALTAVKIAEISAGEASSFLIAAIKGYGLQASDSTRILDVWNEASNKYATSAKEIAIATSEIGGLAKNAGFSLEETAALLIPVIEQFQSGSEASNALKSGMLNLAVTTKPVQEELEKLGVSVTGANGSLRSVRDIINDLAPKWETLTDTQKLYTAGVLFGKDQAAKMNAVMEAMDTQVARTTTLMNAAGSSANELAVKLGASEAQIAQLSVSFEYAAKTLGDQFRSETVGAISGVTALIQAFEVAVNNGGLAPLFDMLKPLLVEFEKNIKLIAAALPEAMSKIDYSGFTRSLQNLGSAIANLTEGADITTVEGLTKALQKLVDFLSGLNNVAAGAVSGLEPFLKAIAGVVDAFTQMSESQQLNVGQIAGTVTAIHSIAGSLETLATTLSTVSSVLATLLGGGGLALLGRQAITAVAGLGSLTLAAAGPAGAAAALAAVGLAGYETGKLLGGEALGNRFGAWLYDLVNPAEQLNTTVAAVTSTVAEQDKTVQGLTDTAKKVDLEPAKKQERDFDAEVNKATQSIDAQEKALLEKLKPAYDGTAISAKDLGEKSGKVNTIFDETGKVIGYSDALGGISTQFKGVSASVDPAKKSMEEAQKKAEEMKIKLLELASDERIKAMEFSASIQTTQIKADSEMVVASLDSIGKSVESNASLLASLFTNAPDWDQFGFSARQYSEDANNRLNELNDAQIKLITAQTDYLNRKAQSGNADIVIQAAGLEPELEAFMFRILDKIRLRMSAEQSAYLLGV